ncbi:MAG: UDP-N-acetylmuramoyl-L-alanine--D-glutamate ligase [Holosporales bacterium]|jgi:UDP-N-acetylmuramoylalanine--D-glutamate ligase|nr:UDP-N-acetylmuramoyl-L-alanine--D-glutamate ligase [Holosporales bacterium]
MPKEAGFIHIPSDVPGFLGDQSPVTSGLVSRSVSREPFMPSKSVLVLGIGKSGQATCDYFSSCNVGVLKFDDKLRGDDIVNDVQLIKFADILLVVQSPGVPFDHPVAITAKNYGLEVYSDIDIFMQAVREHAAAESTPPPLIIGVTGTNGKSTTVSLIGQILRKRYRNVFVGGNIGTPALSLLTKGADHQAGRITSEGRNDQPACDDLIESPYVYVLELSSYQLELSRSLALDFTILTNLTPDHIDRHGSFENYVNSKKKIFAHPNSEVVVCVDDEPSKQIYKEYASQKQTITTISERVGADVLVDSRGTCHFSDGTCLNLAENSDLLGHHNWVNMAVACVIGRRLEVLPTAAIITSLKGMPHRIEIVDQFNDVIFVNDSKATNAESTIKALNCFSESEIFLVAGGRPKTDGIAPAIPHMNSVKEVFLIGDATDRFASELGKIKHRACGNLACALEQAFMSAISPSRLPDGAKKVVLLSPACASFDQFKNYEERGDTFKVLVRDLLKKERNG